MQREKGIVMKVDGPNAIVMTADRRFLKVPAQSGIRIGQEIEVNRQIGKNRSVWTKAGVLAASVALVAGLWQLSGSLQPVKASAYIAVDINPSIELSINKEKDVLQVIPLNDDGKKLVDHLDYKGKHLEQVIAAITGEAAKQGFIKPDGEILVTASDAGISGVDIAGLEKDAITSVESTLKQTGIATNVGGVLVSSEVREQAKQLGVSPGKYALYLQAQARQIPVTIDDLKKQSVSAIAQQHGAEIKDIVRNMDGGKELDQLLAELKQKPPATQAATDKNNEVPNDNKESSKDNKKDDKHSDQSNGKKPGDGTGQPASRDGINNIVPNVVPKSKVNGQDEDKGNQSDLQNRIRLPILPRTSGGDNQGEQSDHQGQSQPSSITPRVPLKPSLPILEVTFSLNSRHDKKTPRNKKFSNNTTVITINVPNGKTGSEDKRQPIDAEK